MMLGVYLACLLPFGETEVGDPQLHAVKSRGRQDPPTRLRLQPAPPLRVLVHAIYYRDTVIVSRHLHRVAVADAIGGTTQCDTAIFADKSLFKLRHELGTSGGIVEERIAPLHILHVHLFRPPLLREQM